ncbi:MAG: hypothetical protein U0531_02440 [Dehalococcoidia bacterium]
MWPKSTLLRAFDASVEVRELTPEGEVRAQRRPRRARLGRPGRRAAGRGDRRGGPGGRARVSRRRPRSKRVRRRRGGCCSASRRRGWSRRSATHVPAVIADDLDDADMVITLRNYYPRKPSMP